MLTNDTPFETFVFPFRWHNGEWRAVVVAKAMFDIHPGGQATISLQKPEINITDQHYGEDQHGSIRLATDLVPMKRNIDIVVVGKAYAETNERKSIVSLRMSSINKRLIVLGERCWKDGLLGPRISKPEVLGVAEIRYEYSYGGIDDSRSKRYSDNPHGRGYRAFRSKLDKTKQEIPTIFYEKDDIKSVGRGARPAGFGYVTSENTERTQYLGTYDEKWQNENAPYFAEDFSYNYFNSAPLDQQLPKQSLSGQKVELLNLNPKFKKLECKIASDFPVLKIEKEELSMDLDTICIQPDELQYYAVWRTTLSLSSSDVGELQQLDLLHRQL